MTRILDIGSGDHSTAETFFPDISDKEIVRLDINPDHKPDVVHDIAAPLPVELVGTFDLVLALHVMEHMDRVSVVNAFKNAASALKNMGEIWVAVPSLEWACDKILSHQEGTYVQQIVFGGQADVWDYHRCGFTMRALRQMVEISGLVIKKAYQSTFTVRGEDKEYECIQNVVIGAKYDFGPEDAIK